MAITFRHDAAAVALPANSANRKYGQQLVLQQQQQKYQGHQSGLDRLFDANKQQQQNMFQFGRDQQQRNFQWDMGQAQNQFQEGRDKARFEQQQQAQEAARQQGFLDDARKQSSGFITEAIKNGEYDPATARKLQQNLVAEAEALGNPQLDATQRAEVLEKIRAERTLLASNRMEKPPEPTPQEKFNQGIVVDPETGTRFRINSKGDHEPLPPKEQQPKTAQDYYSANEDKFQKDLDATMQSMQDEVDLGKSTGPVTPEAAWKKMQEAYDFRQKALGRSSQPPAGAPPAGSGSLPVIPPARGTVDPVTGQQLQTGAVETMPGQPPQMTQQAARDAIAGMQDQMSGVRITDDGQRVVPAPLGPPMPHLRTDSGIPVTPPDQGQPPSPVPQREPMPVTSNSSSLNPEQMPGGSSDVPLESTPGRKGIIGGSAQEETGGITIESASEAAQQYEAAAQAFQELQPKMQAIGQELNNLNSGPWSTNKDVVKRKKELKEEKKKLESLSKQYQESMKAADETAKGYYDQEIAKQPAVKNLSKAGKRPQDFAEAEFQLQNLRKQYPDMGSMPAEAKKQLIEAMAVIQAGR